MTYQLLIIASDFPPLAGTNTQRVQSFVRYLPKFGWNISVITRAIEDLTLIDSGQLDRLDQDLTVYRVRDPDVFAWLGRRRGGGAVDLKQKNNEQSLGKEFGASVTEKAAVQPRSPLRVGLSLASELVMVFRRYFSYLPDALAPWANASAKMGEKICHEKGIQVVFASAPSYSCLIAGLDVAKRCGLPFVADFRDLWVGRPYRRVASRWHEGWDRYLERKVVMGAHRIILASPAWLAYFQDIYGKLIAEKCVVITNGYDKSLYKMISKCRPSPEGVTTFLNTGAMYGSESPVPFLEALGNLLQRKPELREKVRVRLIGYARDDEKILLQTVDRWNLNLQVEFTGPKSHDFCLIEQHNADVLLLCLGVEHRNTISGKSFEYMATGKTILAMLDKQGIQADLLREAGTAVILQHGDLVSTERAIEALLTKREEISCVPNWPFIHSFERTELTGKLAAAMNELV